MTFNRGVRYLFSRAGTVFQKGHIFLAFGVPALKNCEKKLENYSNKTLESQKNVQIG